MVWHEIVRFMSGHRRTTVTLLGALLAFLALTGCTQGASTPTRGASAPAASEDPAAIEDGVSPAPATVRHGQPARYPDGLVVTAVTQWESNSAPGVTDIAAAITLSVTLTVDNGTDRAVDITQLATTMRDAAGAEAVGYFTGGPDESGVTGILQPGDRATGRLLFAIDGGAAGEVAVDVAPNDGAHLPAAWRGAPA